MDVERWTVKKSECWRIDAFFLSLSLFYFIFKIYNVLLVLSYINMKPPQVYWIVVLEKTLESPLDSKEIQPVHPKRDQSWVFIGKTDAEAETPILWPPHVKCWLIGKDPDAWRDWGHEKKGTKEDEMAWWHHWLDGLVFEWTPGVGDGQ